MATFDTIKNVLTGPTSTKIIPAELLRPSFYGMLMVYYAVLALYGVTAVSVGVISIAATTGSHFTFIWSVLISIVGLCAAFGVWLSRRWKKEWVEVASTSIVVGLMAGYGVAIITRALTMGHVEALSTAWLPFIISVLPTWRLAMIAMEGDLFKKYHIKQRG